MAAKSTYFEPSLEKKLRGHKNSITALFFNSNSQQIASSSLDNSVLLWDLRDTMRSYRFQGHDEAVMDVTFSPSGKYMASASRDKTVRLWVPTVTGSTGMFKAHSQTVRSVQFNHDGTKIITASDDKIVKLWSTDKYKFISSFVGHTNWVRCARISSDGSVIASCSDDKSTKLWSPDSTECIHSYKDQKGHGMCLAWHPSGCYIAVGTSHGNIKLYDVRTHTLVQYYSVHDDAVSQLAFHPSGSYILTGSKDGKMKILDLLEGHPIFTLSGHTGAVNAVNFSANGDSFASAGDDKLVFLWKTNFTELMNDVKENVADNVSTITKSASQSAKLSTRGRAQGTRNWYLCYHSTRIPVATFVHLDDAHDLTRYTNIAEELPLANSTFIEPYSQTNNTVGQTSIHNSSLRQFTPSNSRTPSICRNSTCVSHNVGHMSHIPRTPPKQTTFIKPPILNKSACTMCDNDDDLFGMIKLQENDVCYTSGTIEWVGRKRNYPINSGFKLLNENSDVQQSPCKKRKSTFSHENVCPRGSHQGRHETGRKNSFSFGKNTCNNSEIDKFKECDCADVLPTVNAIVDHLNALHEAVDIVGLRLNTIEDVISKNDD